MAVKKYIDLSGLSAFYDHLKTTYQPELTGTGSGAKLPPQTSAVLNAVAPGVEAYQNLVNNSAAYSSGFAYISAMLDKTTYFDGTSAHAAKSATSATKASSAAAADKLKTGRTIAASGDATLSDITFDGSTDKTGKIIINHVPASAISSVPQAAITSVAWSAISQHAGPVDASTTNKFVTPKAVNDAIASAMVEKASWIGPETALSDFTTPYDKTAIYLVGPIAGVSGADKYNEYIFTGNPVSGTTANFVMIGDTTTDLADYMKTATFESWSSNSNSLFNGSASKAGTATSANNASRLGGVTATTVTGNAASGAAASAWIVNNMGNYASADHEHAYKLNVNSTSLDISGSSPITLTAGANVNLSVNGRKVTISAADTTYSSLNSINSNEFNVLSSVSSLTGVKNYGTIKATSGSTTVGTFTPAGTASTFTFAAGNNISFTSGNNTLTINGATPPTPGNGTITITTTANGAATGSFTVNQSSATTIKLGTMALAQTGDYIATSDMIPYSAQEIIDGINW